MITCPRCGASGDDPCRTAGGKLATSEHVGRSQVVRTPRALEAAVREAVAGAYWLQAVDRPAVDLAATLARKIDERIWAAEHVAVGSLFDDAALGGLDGGLIYDAQTFHTILGSLGLTPKGRTELAITERETDDKFDNIVALYDGR